MVAEMGRLREEGGRFLEAISSQRRSASVVSASSKRD